MAIRMCLEIFRRGKTSWVERPLPRSLATGACDAKNWGDPEGLLEALVALSRVRGEGGPTEIFLAVSEMDGRRPAGQRLSPRNC